MKKLLAKLANWFLYDDSYAWAICGAGLATIVSVAVMALT